MVTFREFCCPCPATWPAAGPSTFPGFVSRIRRRFGHRHGRITAALTAKVDHGLRRLLGL